MAACPQSLMRPARRGMALSGVVVLMYHGVSRTDQDKFPREEEKYWISHARFCAQLGQLRSRRLRVALLEEIWSFPESCIQGDRTVAITFDDGRVADYETSFPALVEAGVRATFFLNTANIGKPGYLTWPQISEMQGFGMSFQSHGHQHVYFTRLNASERERQLTYSKKLLEDRMGRPVEYFSAPYGDLDSCVVREALGMGYRAVCNSRNLPAHPSRAVINRVAVYRRTTPRAFRQLVNGNPFCYAVRMLRSMLVHVPKKLILQFRPIQQGARMEEKQV